MSGISMRVPAAKACPSSSIPERLAFVLIDGVGDVALPELGNRTPLEAAHTPHLDEVAGVRMCEQRAASTNQYSRGLGLFI